MNTEMNKLTDIVVSDLIYCPSPDQRKAKTAYWSRVADSGLVDMNNSSLTQVLRILPGEGSRLTKWWSVPGFKEWFTNQEEFRERVENLVHLSLDILQEILLDSENPKNASARVNAAKLLMEIGRKMPPKGVREVYVDDKVSKMTRVQLEEFLRRNTPQLPGSADETNNHKE